MSKAIIGSSVIREDGWAKVTGQAKYPADLNKSGQIYGAVVRSPHPHAQVTAIHKEKAQKLPGILTILTHEDVLHNKHGVLFRDQPVLAQYIRMVGDPVAAVAAETDEAARTAAELIEIDYKLLPAVFDPEESMKEGQISLHPEYRPNNVLFHLPIRKGTMEKGWEEADVIVEKEYSTQMVDHAYLQPEAVLAYVNEQGRVIVEVATQYVHYDRGEIAHILGLKASQVQVKSTFVGGAFGGREDISIQAIAALLAWKTRRPVKMENNREECFYAHCKRHPVKMYYKTGATKDGKLTAMEGKIIGDAGAYASWSINVMRKAAVHATGPYEIPNVQIDSYAVFTNNPYAGAMRGFGAAQPVLAYESQMDLLAQALNIPPWEIRMRNAFQIGSKTATGQLLTGSVGIKECLERVMPYMERWGSL